MQECSKSTVQSCFFQIGIVQHNSRGFATQLQKHGLNVLASRRSDNRTHMAAARKGDLAHSRVRNQRIGHLYSVRAAVVEDIHTASRDTSLLVDIPKSPETLGRKLRALEHGRVTGCQRKGDGTGSEDEWRIPKTRGC